MPFELIPALSHPIAALPDRVEGSAAFMKDYFDRSPAQLMAALNALIAALEATDPGRSAAECIGSGPLGDLPAGSLHSQLAAIAARIDARTPVTCAAAQSFLGHFALTPHRAVSIEAGTPVTLQFVTPAAATGGHTLQVAGYGPNRIPVVDRGGAPIPAGAFGLGAPVEVCLYGERAYLR